jgi:hypothetical protein
MKLKEKQTVSQRTIVIDIKPTRGLVVALSCVLTGVALLAYLMLAGERVVASGAGASGEASPAQSTGKRQFYLTLLDEFDGSEALTACAPGYHMASLWEIADPSNLEYNTALGYTRTDSGQGPPTDIYGYGWVRTGYVANSDGAAGEANCDVWSTVGGAGVYGSEAGLSSDWTSGSADVDVWDIGLVTCSTGRRVWCMED